MTAPERCTFRVTLTRHVVPLPHQHHVVVAVVDALPEVSVSWEEGTWDYGGVRAGIRKLIAQHMAIAEDTFGIDLQPAPLPEAGASVEGS